MEIFFTERNGPCYMARIALTDKGSGKTSSNKFIEVLHFAGEYGVDSREPKPLEAMESELESMCETVDSILSSEAHDNFCGAYNLSKKSKLPTTTMIIRTSSCSKDSKTIRMNFYNFRVSDHHPMPESFFEKTAKEDIDPEDVRDYVYSYLIQALYRRTTDRNILGWEPQSEKEIDVKKKLDGYIGQILSKL